MAVQLTEKQQISHSVNGFEVKQLGLIDYQSGWNLQKHLHNERVADSIPNTLLFLEHHSVYTAGRRTDPSELPLDGTEVINVDRGGKITWHGPGQIVGYLIAKLKNPSDVVGFVRVIEESLIEVCEKLGIKTERYCERSGVWIRDAKGDRKIAAIGIRVAKGVTTHGFALNVNPELSAYNRIVPCGIRDAGVTSIATEKPTAQIDQINIEKLIEQIMIPKLAQICI